MLDETWKDQANCKGEPVKTFFPEDNSGCNQKERVSRVYELCGKCEVKEECLNYALDNNEKFGVWGGLGEKRRRYLRMERLGIKLL